MKFVVHFAVTLFLLVGTSSALAIFDGEGNTRVKNDMDPRTLNARRHFDVRTKKLFSQSQQRYNVRDVQLKMNPRMVAQRARGAESANAVLPVELDRLLKFIGEARTNREAVIERLMNVPSLRKYDRAQFSQAVSRLAKVKKIDLNYWGYIGRSLRLPEYSSESRRLTFFAKWNEYDSRYELYPSHTQRILVIKGLLSTE